MTPVLYDAPGPRARRITLIVSVVSAVLVVASLYYVVYRPLDEYGQFTAKKWGPLVDPDDKNFDLLWGRLGDGLQATAIAAVLSIAAALLVGTALAVLRVWFGYQRQRRFEERGLVGSRALRWATAGGNGLLRAHVEFYRGLPVVLTIYFVARVLPEFGLDWDALWYIVAGLTLYNSVVIAEILRSGMTGLPGGQGEAAAAMGFSPMAIIRLILLPQSYRIMLPALISQLVVIVKDTSLGFLISYEDLLAVGNQAVNVLRNPIQLYVAIGLIFILVNFTLSLLAVWVQRRVAQGRKVPATAAATAPASVAADRAVT